MTSNLGSLYAHIANHLKPHRAEALYRVRVNGVCLVTGIIVSYLLPLPSVHKAIHVVRRPAEYESGSRDWLYRWFCTLEIATLSLFLLNIIHALYSVRYPRTSFPPLASPEKPRGAMRAPVTPQRPFRALSPNSSPQPQKPFSFSPSSSFGLSVTANYPTSPVSTPSRVVHYPVPPNSSTNTQMSTSSSINLLSTPSPVISAYRGKHLSNSVGRALDGSFLGQLIPESTNDDD